MRSSSRKSNRPSTAPSGALHPSLHIQPAISLSPPANANPSLTSEGDVSPNKMQTVLEDDGADISLTFSMLATHCNKSQTVA